jgi:hyperosmotically inducible protein
MRTKHLSGKTLVIAALCGGLTAIPFAAGAQSNESVAAPTGAQDALFRHLDTDKDGFVSRDEAARSARFLESFAVADDNRDGRLSPDEYLKARSAYDRARAAQYATDSAITAKAKLALIKAAGISGKAISVETHDAEVLLSGFVEDRQQVERARAIVGGIDGVKQVHSLLLVKG